MFKMELKKPSKHEGWHCVFKNKKEFEEYFLKEDGIVPYLANDWRECKAKDWVIADDGGVVQVLKVMPIKSPSEHTRKMYATTYVGTIIGLFLCNKKEKMDTDRTLRNYKNGGRNKFGFGSGKIHPKKWNEQIRLKKKNTFKDKMFILYLLIANRVAIEKGDKEFVSMEALSQAYMSAFRAKNDARIQLKAKLLFNQERIQVEVRKGIKEIAKDCGITEETVLKNYDSLMKTAKDESVRLKATEKLADITEVTPIQEKITQSSLAYFGLNAKQLEEAEMSQIEEKKKE